MFKLNFAGSSSASAANTAPFNFSSGNAKAAWLPWVVGGVVLLFVAALWFRSKKGK